MLLVMICLKQPGDRIETLLTPQFRIGEHRVHGILRKFDQALKQAVSDARRFHDVFFEIRRSLRRCPV